MPLGNDYDSREKPTTIGPDTVIRCEQALKKLRSLQAEGHQVFMILPTPSLRRHDSKTMALMMYEWFINVSRATEVEYVVNRTGEDYPHTTYGELLWGLPAAIAYRRQLHMLDGSSCINDLSDTTIVIVSNRRHLRRVRWIIELMLTRYRRRERQNGFVSNKDYTAHYQKPRIQFEVSSEPPSSLRHEFLSYSKLVLIWFRLVKP